MITFAHELPLVPRLCDRRRPRPGARVGGRPALVEHCSAEIGGPATLLPLGIRERVLSSSPRPRFRAEVLRGGKEPRPPPSTARYVLGVAASASS